MDVRKLQFLEAIVGTDGANALAKSAGRAAELEAAIIPRVITAWLDAHAPFGYDGTVPGQDSRLAFAKSEQGYDGHIVLDGNLHQFTDASMYHLAGCVAVALGLDHERVSPMAKNEHIAKLGKSIDLLVKSRVFKLKKGSVKELVKKAQMNPGNKAKLPGVAAQAIGPTGPTAPTATQPGNQKAQPAGAAGSSTASPLPKVSVASKSKPTMKVTKSQASVKCVACGRPQFTADSFTGCFCFSALAKSVRTSPTADGFTLAFGNQWDEDAIDTLSDTFRGK